jgi:rubrerythrin
MKCELTDDQIIQLLAQHEQAIGRLYQVYAERFPEHKAFWSRLAAEEAQHADWLQRLLVRVKEGLGCVRSERFDAREVQDSLANIAQMIDQAAGPDFSSSDALANAAQMENALLEAQYFEIFQGQAAEVTQVQYCLADATRDHSREIQELLSATD